MLTSKVAKRYAQGLLDFSVETGNLQTVYSEMKDVAKLMDSSRELNLFFATPFIDLKKKTAVANQIFANFSHNTKNFINLVIKHGRETQLRNIAQEFVNKVDEQNGVQKVQLTTATELFQNNVDEILKSTSLYDPNKPHDIKLTINPEILGGYILRIGDQQIDASVKSKLNNLKKEFQLN